MKKILFVCTGNTCRSPMAEGLFRRMAKQHGLDYEVRSAGVHAVDGMPISKHSAGILQQQGIVDQLTSSALNEDIVSWADLILTMSFSHKAAVIQVYPEAVNKTFTLKEYVLDDPEAIGKMKERDRLLSELQTKQALSQPITSEEVDRLYAMEDELPSLDIEDPFGGPLETYESCAQDIEAQLMKLIVKIQQNRP